MNRETAERSAQTEAPPSMPSVVHQPTELAPRYTAETMPPAPDVAPQTVRKGFGFSVPGVHEGGD